MKKMNDNMNKVVTEEDLRAVAERNEQRVREVIKAMGDKYLLHPKNHIKLVKCKTIYERKADQANC